MKQKEKKSNQTKKFKKIAKILGLLEEKSLTKDWLLTILRKKKIRFSSSPTSNSFEILENCSETGIEKILKILEQESGVKDIKTLTKTLHWFFTDMVGSSDPTLSVKAQARKINALNSFIENSEIFKKSNPNSLVILPTGDGMAIGFTDSPEKPLILAIQIHKALKKYNKNKREKDRVEIRIGIDTGPVYFMKGIVGTDIFWGPGLILARRVMDLCESNQILASGRIAKDLSSLSEENKATIKEIGEYQIKHGELLTIYSIFGKDFGIKFTTKGKEVKKETEFTKSRDFEFNSIDIKLEIKDPKTMMTHHTWTWDVKNTSTNPLGAIFYRLEGDIPKDFAEMNVKIHDENNNRLEIASIDVNRPSKKEFHVKLKKPIKINQRKRILKLEYDWEEPARMFDYTFSSNCKKFRYKFIIPNGVQFRNRILETVRELGIKRRVDSAPKITYNKTFTEISWETNKDKKMIANDAFEFQW